MTHIDRVKNDFPIFKNNPGLIFLDSGASAQKPQCVIDAVTHFMSHDYANIHRGVYRLSELATASYEEARSTVGRFLNAGDDHAVVLCRGVTEAINTVAHGFRESVLSPGDEIIVSEMAHHANLVPWQVACERTGAILKVIPVNEDGTLDLDTYAALLSPNTQLVAVSHASNVLGTINPIETIIAMAHDNNTPVLIDGAQAVPHIPVDVTALDADFYLFSGHKAYGPSGSGALIGKREWLDRLPPYQTGGGMIEQVTLASSTYQQSPARFEAGTPAISAAVGLKAALDYLTAVGMETVAAHADNLTKKMLSALVDMPGLRLLGHAPCRVPVFSFTLKDAHAHDVATILDGDGIAVRAGHHCAMPLHQRFGVNASVRVSFGLYNNESDVDALMLGLKKVNEVFA